MWNTCGECSAHSEWLQYVAQKEYKGRHDKVCLSIHRALCKKYVVKSDVAKILWDVCIQVDRQIEHRRPDIVVLENNAKKCLIIDVACPVDNNLIPKRNEKLDNYSELRLEIARMWDKETLIVPIIIGPLESIRNDLECNLEKLGMFYNVGTLQKSVLLGTANILRKVLSIKQ